MQYKIKALTPSVVLTLLSMFMVLSTRSATAQSFPPGTGREWKRHPVSATEVKVRGTDTLKDAVAAREDANKAATKAQSDADEATRNAFQSANDEVTLRAQALILEQNLAVATADAAAKTTAAGEKATTDAAVSGANAKVTELTSKLNDAKQAVSDAHVKTVQTRSDAAFAQTVLTRKKAVAQAAADRVATIKFSDTDQGAISFTTIQVPAMTAGTDTFSVAVSKSGSTDNTNDFKVVTNCVVDEVGKRVDNNPCVVVVGFRPSKQGAEQAALAILKDGSPLETDAKGTTLGGTLSGSGTAQKTSCVEPTAMLAPLNHAVGKRRVSDPEVKPTKAQIELDKQVSKLQARLDVDFGTMLNTIYCFYSQSGAFNLLGQVKTSYNSTASSSTTKADIGSLAFLGGVQLSLGSSVQASASQSTTAAKTAFVPRSFPTTTFTPPMLTTAQAAQSAQNLINGGNLSFNATWPLLLVSPKNGGRLSNFSLLSVVNAREGVDIPNFLGTTMVSTDLENHFNTSNEWYLQFDALPPQGGKDSAGAVFVDGKYGYNYASAEFTRTAGFKKDNNGIGQVNVGMVIVGIVSVSAQHTFGPSQYWIDSTSTDGAITHKNNFRGWALSINFASNQKSGGSQKTK